MINLEPTAEQKDTLWRISYQLTKMYVPINLVRMDERSGYMIVLAGDEFVIEIQKNGIAEYV
jgi:hypothetical protein